MYSVAPLESVWPTISRFVLVYCLRLVAWSGPDLGLNLRVMDVSGAEATVRDFLRAGHHEIGGAISPDGEWVAYRSDESGEFAIYVRRLADAADPTEIAGGDDPRWPVWGPQGTQLYYMTITEDGADLMRVPVTSTPAGFTAGQPDRILTLPFSQSRASFGGRNWDLSPDGRSLIVVVEPRREGPPRPAVRAELVVNWFQELRNLGG